MADEFGATFAPFPDPSGRNANINPVQQAIQLLSLRIPRVVGAAAPAPAALLNSPGSGGRPDVHSAVLQSVLRTIMAQPEALGVSAPPPSPVTVPPLDAPPVATEAPAPIVPPTRGGEPGPGAPPPSPFPEPRRDAPVPQVPVGPSIGGKPKFDFIPEPDAVGSLPGGTAGPGPEPSLPPPDADPVRRPRNRESFL